MFMLKQFRNKLCNMASLLPTEMDKAYPEQLLKILRTGVAAAVTKPEGGKRGWLSQTTQSAFTCLWVVWGSHPFFPPSGFVTTAATPVLIIFTSCSGYALSISVGSKCYILHSLFMQCFIANILHVRSFPFSLSKPFTLGSQ